MNPDNSNSVSSVAEVVKKADDRLYRTLIFAPVIARFVYFIGFVVVCTTGYVLKTRWDIADLYKVKAEKSAVDGNVKEIERNAKIVDGIYKDFYKREPPPR